MSIKINQICFGVLSVLATIIFITLGFNPYFCLVMLVWLNMVVYSMRDLANRSVLLGFLITFFLFLLGRDFLQVFIKYKVENFNENINKHAYMIYGTALCTLFVTFITMMQGKNKGNYLNVVLYKNWNIEFISRYVFYILIIFSIISKLIVVRFVSNFSYYEYYTDYSAYMKGNIVISMLNILERMMPASFCCFLACFPSKKKLEGPLILYLMYLMISLGTKARSTTMLGLLFIALYFLYRNALAPNEKWINKRIILMIILAIPVLAVVGTTINNAREKNASNDSSIIMSFFNFFYDQGVTSNVIKRAYIYRNRLQQNSLYTLEFLHSGIFAKILGLTVYYGNSIEHALSGTSMAHSLGYLVLGTQYLEGHGTGTSYLAEFFQDFGYFGVILGTAFYGLLISKILNFKKMSQNIWIRTIQLFLIQRILWAPRGSFSDIISSLCSWPVIFVLLFICYLSRLSKSMKFRDKYLNKYIFIQNKKWIKFKSQKRV